MNKIVLKPEVQIFTKTVTDKNGRVFEVCCAIFESNGQFQTKILGVRAVSPVSEIKSNCSLFLPKPKVAEVVAQPRVSPYFYSIDFVLKKSFIISQPTRAPDEC